MMQWTSEALAALPLKNGVRLRGLEMTRLETFTDAAFAFATTLLVISLGGIPESYDGLVEALKGTPAFAASFGSVASFWYSHRKWSRRYGLEDGLSIIISLAMIFVMLVYVYPLKMVFSALFAWLSNGYFPTNFILSSGDELTSLFVIYGIGFFAMALSVSLLYLRALRGAGRLCLDEIELVRTRQELASFGVLAVTGLLSALTAWTMPLRVGVWSGFIYVTLSVSMPLVATYFEKRVARLERGRAGEKPETP